jgi:hypothetical protein
MRLQGRRVARLAGEMGAMELTCSRPQRALLHACIVLTYNLPTCKAVLFTDLSVIVDINTALLKILTLTADFSPI